MSMRPDIQATEARGRAAGSWQWWQSPGANPPHPRGLQNKKCGRRGQMYIPGPADGQGL